MTSAMCCCRVPLLRTAIISKWCCPLVNSALFPRRRRESGKREKQRWGKAKVSGSFLSYAKKGPDTKGKMGKMGTFLAIPCCIESCDENELPPVTTPYTAPAPPAESHRLVNCAASPHSIKIWEKRPHFAHFLWAASAASAVPRVLLHEGLPALLSLTASLSMAMSSCRQCIATA